jgi:transcriptional regulator with XRE-family HTH domain
MNINKGIKTLLKSNGLSQKDLAEKTNLSEASISKIMNGLTQPRKETLEIIANALNVKPEVIVLLSIDKEDIPEDRKHVYDLLWGPIETNILALFT